MVQRYDCEPSAGQVVAWKCDRTDNVGVSHDDEIDFLSALLEHEFTDAVFSDGESIVDVKQSAQTA